MQSATKMLRHPRTHPHLATLASPRSSSLMDRVFQALPQPTDSAAPSADTRPTVLTSFSPGARAIGMRPLYGRRGRNLVISRSKSILLAGAAIVSDPGGYGARKATVRGRLWNGPWAHPPARGDVLARRALVLAGGSRTRPTPRAFERTIGRTSATRSRRIRACDESASGIASGSGVVQRGRPRTARRGARCCCAHRTRRRAICRAVA